MSDTGIKPRLVIMVFALACASVLLSTVLLVSQILAPRAPAVAVAGPDPLVSVEKSLAKKDWSGAWSQLLGSSDSDELRLNQRGIALVWRLWQSDPRGPSLVELASKRFAHKASVDERAMLCYLLLQAGQGKTAASLAGSGEFRDKYPSLDAELALERHPDAPVSFAAIVRIDQGADTRLALDRAFALGYLGDFDAAREQADRVVRLTDPPGVNGDGLIDASRGLCRRQIARTIQIMSLWDARDRSATPLMKAAARELLADPDGYVLVAPSYFDLLCDALAWVGMKNELIAMYAVADRHHHPLGNELAETRSVVSDRPALRPASYRDLRTILARPSSSDTRGDITDIQEAAWSHNDERSFRLLAWYLWKTGDNQGLRALLDKNKIKRGAWFDLYAGVLDENAGSLVEAREAMVSAASGSLEASAVLNQARLRFREGQVEIAASLAEEALSLIELRSLGLQDKTGTAYAGLYADALAIRARIFETQGQSASAQALLKHVNAINPQHPALYQATGIAVSPETGMEQSRDSTQE